MGRGSRGKPRQSLAKFVKKNSNYFCGQKKLSSKKKEREEEEKEKEKGDE